IEVKADFETKPGSHKVLVVAQAEGQPLVQVQLDLQIKESKVVWHPEWGWKKVEGAVVQTDPIDGRLFYDKIDVERGGQLFRFLLIPRAKNPMQPDGEKQTHPPTFYIMENKVSVGAFKRFAVPEMASYAL